MKWLARLALLPAFLAALSAFCEEPLRKTQVIPYPENPTEYYHLLSPPMSVAMRSGLVTLKPGESVGRHPTGKFEELVIVLEGEGEMTVFDSGKVRFHKGQAVYAPPNLEHDVTNVGKSPLRYIYVVGSAAMR